jgi:hypothetical protein
MACGCERSLWSTTSLTLTLLGLICRLQACGPVHARLMEYGAAADYTAVPSGTGDHDSLLADFFISCEGAMRRA